MNEGTATTVLGPFEQMVRRVADYLPSLAAGLLILLLGVAVCWLVKKLVFRLVLLMRLDRAFRNVRWSRGLEQADVRYALANTLGNIASGVIFLVFLNNALVIWGLQVLAQLIGGLVSYLPRFILGVLVLTAGTLAVSAVSIRIRAGLAAEGVARAGLAAKLIRWGLMLLVVACTLEELAVAPHTLNTTLKIGLGSIGLVLALAIGLGSRDAVARMWEGLRNGPPRDQKLP